MPFKACVVATGGGVVTRRQNWGYMQHGIVAWLHGPPELLARRACRDDIKSRPLLGNLDGSQEEAEVRNPHRTPLWSLLIKLKPASGQITTAVRRRLGCAGSCCVQLAMGKDQQQLHTSALLPWESVFASWGRCQSMVKLCHSTQGPEDRIAATQQRLFGILDKRREQYAQADLTVSLEDAKGANMGAPVAVVTYRYRLRSPVLRATGSCVASSPCCCTSLEACTASNLFEMMQAQGDMDMTTVARRCMH